jgi:polysaccharide export outer membrane protein
MLAASLAILLAGACAGCASFIPLSGPKRSSVVNSSAIMVENVPAPTLGFALVRLDGPTSMQLGEAEKPPVFGPDEVNEPDSAIRVGLGDVLQITVFETGAGGLFIPLDAGSRPGNFVQLPPQEVGQDGEISVPYAGKIRALGRTPISIQTEIAHRLAHRALEPQVLVSFAEKHANQISVLGDVFQATRFSMDPSGERILGAIARAGGPRFPAYESLVTLQRNGKAETALLAAIAADPRQNVAMQPGDTVYVAHEPRYFLALGAAGTATSLSQVDRRFPFGDYEIHLSDALALAGGLEDDRANAQGVFLYRLESRATLERLGLHVPATLPDKIPTIYMVDLTDPTGFFLTNRVMMRSNDTIYVANAPITDLQKILTVLLPFSETAGYVKSVGQID